MMQRMLSFFQHLFLWIFLCFAISSCGNRPIISIHESLGGTWTYHNPLDFSFNIADIENSFDMILQVDYLTSFAYQNIYVKIETEYPDHTKTEDIISLNLTDGKGTFLGDCYSSACEIDIMLQEKFKFKQKGDYKLTIHQHGRIESLSNINGATLMIFQHEE